MKKIKLFTLALLAGAISFTSCGGDDEEQAVPTVSITVSDATPWKGDTVTFTVAISSNETIKELAITETEANADASEETTITTFSGDYSATHDYVYVIKTSGLADGDVITVTFKVTDDKDGVTTETAIITLTEPAAATTPFAMEKTGGMFYHISGTEHGAYDLDGDATVGSTGAATAKSMKNTDAAGATFTGSWTSDNGTTFVKDNAYDYTTGDTVAAETAFTNGSDAADVANPAVNDIYIAKKGSTYYAIKILTVDPTVEGGMNDGQITFSYKKN